MIRMLMISVAAFCFTTATALADGKHAAHSAERPYGKPGDKRKVTRTIEVGMSDAMLFTPAEITVKRGETIRFVAGNTGKVKHELVLGTMKELKEHAEAMKKHPGMEHDEEDNAVEVQPGKRGELIWRFTKAGSFSFGCLIPGHFEAGMVGKLTVVP